MQLEDVLVQVVEQQVNDWCNWHNWDIQTRTEAETTIDTEGPKLVLKYNVEITDMWVTTKKRELEVTVQYNEHEQGDVIIGTVDNEEVFSIPLHEVEIETTGPYTVL